MKLTSKDIEELRRILAAAKIMEIEGIVLDEGMARGARIAIDAAIISESKLDIPANLRIGIGRVGELEKRLSIFSGEVSIEGKANDSGDVTLLTIVSGKSKMQYRCQSVNLMQYPKRNEDPEMCRVSISKAEAALIVKSIKTFSADAVVFQVTRTGAVRIECVDSANDKFEIELAAQVKYVDEASSFVQSYNPNLFINILDHAGRDGEEVELVLGEVGSLTGRIKGHTVMIFPLNPGEEDNG